MLCFIKCTQIVEVAGLTFHFCMVYISEPFWKFQEMLSGRAAQTLLLRANKSCVIQVASVHHEKRYIGNREIVGWGVNSNPHYVDRPDYPFPAIRFREIKGDLISLREKEKGNWKNLSLEEKKTLYRTSFCQTFSEMEAPNGQWKSVFGVSLFLLGVGIWMFMALKKYAYAPLPESFSEESRRAQLRRMLDLKVNPVTGISSKWDYEKDDWKK